MKHNFHNHTFRCQHARGKDEEFVLAAIENGFSKIGFSDHCAWRFKDPGFVSTMRMRVDEIADYVGSVRSLQEKYSDKIEILLGWEVEYFPQYMSWMKETLEEYGFDYVILGHHFTGDELGGLYNGSLKTKKQIERYADDVCAAMEDGLFSYLAHPELFMRGYRQFDKTAQEISRRIIKTSIETGTPLEFNLLGVEYSRSDGIDGYPHPEFWKIAGEEGAVGILGLDAHAPEKYSNSEIISFGEAELSKCGVKITDEIGLLR